VKLSAWAAQEGIHYQTAWRMFKSGKLPVPVKQLPTGTIIVDDNPQEAGAALYARVSSSDQKKDLEAQIGRLAVFAAGQKLTVIKTVAEVGSGLNGHRQGLIRLLTDPKVRIIVVEHRDRLMRFGAEFVEATLAADGRKLLVVDTSELKDDLVADVIAVLTSMCARLYGRRSANNRAKRALTAMQGEVPDDPAHPPDAPVSSP
jgi:predicted site-specific integrase-resolvase